MQKVGEGKLSTNQRLVDLNQIQKRYNDNRITILDELAAEWSKYLATMAGNERAALISPQGTFQLPKSCVSRSTAASSDASRCASVLRGPAPQNTASDVSIESTPQR